MLVDLSLSEYPPSYGRILPLLSQLTHFFCFLALSIKENISLCLFFVMDDWRNYFFVCRLCMSRIGFDYFLASLCHCWRVDGGDLQVGLLIDIQTDPSLLSGYEILGASCGVFDALFLGSIRPWLSCFCCFFDLLSHGVESNAFPIVMDDRYNWFPWLVALGRLCFNLHLVGYRDDSTLYLLLFLRYGILF